MKIINKLKYKLQGLCDYFDTPWWLLLTVVIFFITLLSLVWVMLSVFNNSLQLLGQIIISQ